MGDTGDLRGSFDFRVVTTGAHLSPLRGGIGRTPHDGSLHIWGLLLETGYRCRGHLEHDYRWGGYGLSLFFWNQALGTLASCLGGVDMLGNLYRHQFDNKASWRESRGVSRVSGRSAQGEECLIGLLFQVLSD